MLMCVAAGILNGFFDSKGNTSAKFFEAGSEPSSSYVLNAVVTFVYVIRRLVSYHVHIA